MELLLAIAIAAEQQPEVLEGDQIANFKGMITQLELLTTSMYFS